jgi:lysophospholipase
MPTTKNQAKILIAVTLFLMIAGCGNKTIISSDTYRGDEKSFAKFKDDYGKADWPEPETIAYCDPEGTGAEVIRYAHWAPPPGNKEGVVVHFNGRTEFIEKNIYTYKDLLDRGYEVWALDWRGQGFSKRQLKDKQKHSIDSFDTYVKDAAYFIDNVTNTKTSNGKKVLLAHSMGGQIALRYLLKYHDTFDYAVLSSPLLGLPGYAWYIEAGNWLKRKTFFADSCVMSKSSTWSDNFEDGNPCSHVNKEIEEDDLDKDHGTKNYSHDLNKVAEIDCLIASSFDANGQENPDLRVACPTTRWLYEANKSTKTVMENAKELQTPILIVRAKEDKAVDPDAQDEFCNQTDKCELKSIPENGEPETGHELLVETEEIRRKFLGYFDEFLKK